MTLLAMSKPDIDHSEALVVADFEDMGSNVGQRDEGFVVPG